MMNKGCVDLKKFFSLVICALLLAASLTSCGGSKTESSAPSSSEPQSSTVESVPESSVPQSSAEESSTVSEETGAADGVTAEAVFDAINAAFAEQYADEGLKGAISNMPMDVDDTVLTEMFGVDPADVVDYRGQMAGTMTNCDMLLVVQAKDGKLDAVVDGLTQARETQAAQFEHYAVMGNPERVEASKVVTEGNYAALLMVGVFGGEEAPDFTEDVKLAEDAFYAAVRGE